MATNEYVHILWWFCPFLKCIFGCTELLYGFETLLANMVDILEDDYDVVLWNDAQFCAAYVTVSSVEGRRRVCTAPFCR